MPALSYLRGSALALATSLLIASTTWAQPPSLPSRLVVKVILVTSDASAKAGLQTWTNLMAVYLTNLLMDSSLGLALGNRVEITPEIRDVVPHGSEIERLWDDLRAIQIVAAVGLKSGKTTTIDANIYVGKLSGRLPRPIIHVRQTVRTDEYARNRDFVAGLMFYALAVDASAHPPVFCRLLQEAATCVRDSKNTQGDSELDVLKTAIETSRAEKCR